MGTHLQCSNVRQQENIICFPFKIVGIYQFGQTLDTDTMLRLKKCAVSMPFMY